VAVVLSEIEMNPPLTLQAKTGELIEIVVFTDKKRALQDVQSFEAREGLGGLAHQAGQGALGFDARVHAEHPADAVHHGANLGRGVAGDAEVNVAESDQGLPEIALGAVVDDGGGLHLEEELELFVI